MSDVADETGGNVVEVVKQLATDIRRSLALLTDIVSAFDRRPPRKNYGEPTAELFELYRTTTVRLPALAARAGVRAPVLRKRFQAQFAEQYDQVAGSKRGRPPRDEPLIGDLSASQLFAIWHEQGGTLDDLGAQLGVTRERVRQVLTTIPAYQAELERQRVLRVGEGKPDWLDDALVAYRLGRPQLARWCERVDISLHTAYRQLKAHHGREFGDIAAAHAASVQKVRMAQIRTPELAGMFQRYRDDKVTIEQLAKESGELTVAVWKRLARAYGEEFREISRTRTRATTRQAATMASLGVASGMT